MQQESRKVDVTSESSSGSKLGGSGRRTGAGGSDKSPRFQRNAANLLSMICTYIEATHRDLQCIQITETTHLFDVPV